VPEVRICADFWGAFPRARRANARALAPQRKRASRDTGAAKFRTGLREQRPAERGVVAGDGSAGSAQALGLGESERSGAERSGAERKRKRSARAAAARHRKSLKCATAPAPPSSPRVSPPARARAGVCGARARARHVAPYIARAPTFFWRAARPRRPAAGAPAPRLLKLSGRPTRPFSSAFYLTAARFARRAAEGSCGRAFFMPFDISSRSTANVRLVRTAQLKKTARPTAPLSSGFDVTAARFAGHVHPTRTDGRLFRRALNRRD
jgi:hypothetical protein